jgi:hypothetical protein
LQKVEPSAVFQKHSDVLGEELAQKLAFQEQQAAEALAEVQRLSATFQRGSPLFAKAQVGAASSRLNDYSRISVLSDVQRPLLTLLVSEKSKIVRPLHDPSSRGRRLSKEFCTLPCMPAPVQQLPAKKVKPPRVDNTARTSQENLAEFKLPRREIHALQAGPIGGQNVPLVTQLERIILLDIEEFLS